MTEIRWEAKVLSIRQSLFSRENSLVASTSIRFSVDRRSPSPFERFPRCNRSNHRNSPAFDEFSSSFVRKCSYVNSFVTDRARLPRFQDFHLIACQQVHAHTQIHIRTYVQHVRTFWILNKERAYCLDEQGVSWNIFAPVTMRTIPNNFTRNFSVFLVSLFSFLFPPSFLIEFGCNADFEKSSSNARKVISDFEYLNRDFIGNFPHKILDEMIVILEWNLKVNLVAF